MDIVQILSEIQAKLKAPKGQFNNFGKYKYRSCEDIVEAVKPLLAEYNAALVISDEIESIGDRVYVKATAAIITGVKGDNSIKSTAYAREPISKKGMDESQITGAASSYARKYALNGLLAIDDTKDADTQSPEQNQQMDTKEIDQVKVEKAYAYIVAQIDNEEQDDTETAKHLKKGWSHLTNDEQIAVNDRLKQVKEGRKQYNTMLREYLNYPEDN